MMIASNVRHPGLSSSASKISALSGAASPSQRLTKFRTQKSGSWFCPPPWFSTAVRKALNLRANSPHKNMSPFQSGMMTVFAASDSASLARVPLPFRKPPSPPSTPTARIIYPPPWACSSSSSSSLLEKSPALLPPTATLSPSPFLCWPQNFANMAAPGAHLSLFSPGLWLGPLPCSSLGPKFTMAQAPDWFWGVRERSGDLEAPFLAAFG